MELTQDMIWGLNNMNVYAQRARLGDLIQAALEGGGGSGTGDTSLITKPSYLEFPNIGNSNNLYIDTTAEALYRWDSKDFKYYKVGATTDDVFDVLENTLFNGGNANG